MNTGIALGSNLGDRTANLAAARDFLRSLHEARAEPLCSAVYETEPVGCAPGAASFLNAVVEIETSLQGRVLLERLRDFEIRCGREKDRAKNTDRVIDLDLLYAGDTRIETTELIVPHPLMTKRRFVMQPLADIRPDLFLPGHDVSVSQILAALPDSPSVRMATRAW